MFTQAHSASARIPVHSRPMFGSGASVARPEAAPSSWTTPTAAARTRSALSDLNNGAAGITQSPPVIEPTPRVKRGVDWSSAAARLDRFVCALTEANTAAHAGAAASQHVVPPSRGGHLSAGEVPQSGLYNLRSTWSVPVTALETHCSGGDSSSAPLTRREEALQRRLEECERLVAKLQLAASLQELQQVTGTLDTTTCAAASTVADSPASERRRAERAEAERDEALAERDATAARCCLLEEELANALETCSLFRRRAEEAELRGRAASHAMPPPPPPPQHQQQVNALGLEMLSLRTEVAAAVAALHGLPRETRRQRVRLLRLQYHPDKQVAMHGLATAVTQLLNAELAAQDLAD
jgi:hypothetical protein